MKFKVHTPRVPNFIKVSHGEASTMYDLTAFTEKELNAVVKAWKEDLFKNRERQSKNNKEDLGTRTGGE